MLEHNVPVIRGVVRVNLCVNAAIEDATVVHGVVGCAEGVGVVEVHNTAISVVWVVEVGYAVVVVVPVNAVFQPIAVHVGVEVVGSVVTIERPVDEVEVVVVVEVTIPIDVQNVDDAVVVVINVIPVVDAIAVPVVELRKGSASCLTPNVRVGWVGVGLSWAVPCGHIRGSIEWERVVFVLNVVVVEVVREICSANGKVSEVIGFCCTAHVRVEPVVDAVVVLVKRPTHVVIKVAVVIELTVDVAVVVAVSSGDLEVHGVHAGHVDGGAGVARGDRNRIAHAVTEPFLVDTDRSHNGVVRDDVDRHPRTCP